MSVKADCLEKSVDGRLGGRAGDGGQLRRFCLFIPQTRFSMGAKTPSGNEGNAQVVRNLERNDLI